MTIYSDLSRNRYIGNGVSKIFAIEFPYLTNADGTAQVAVYVGDDDVPQIEGKDYTVVGFGRQAEEITKSAELIDYEQRFEGGQVIFKEAPENGVPVAVVRNVPQTQIIVFNNGSKFPAVDYENGMDKLTMEIQEVKENLARAIVLPPTSTEAPLEAREAILKARDEAVSSAASALASETAANISKLAAEAAEVVTKASKEEVLENAGFKAVAADLLGDNKIGYVADNLDFVAENVNVATKAAAAANEAAQMAAAAANEAAQMAAAAANEAKDIIDEETAQSVLQIAIAAEQKTADFNDNAEKKQTAVDISASAAASSAAAALASEQAALSSANKAKVSEDEAKLTVDGAIDGINTTKTEAINAIDAHVANINDMIANYSPVTFNLFDVKFSDHLLNNISWLRADTFSWQSGAVYTAAYNELLSEYNNETSVEETDYILRNFELSGSVNITGALAIGFTGRNQLIGKIFSPGTESWQIAARVKTPSAFASTEMFIHGACHNIDCKVPGITLAPNGKIKVNLSSNGSSWNLGKFTSTGKTLATDTWYNIRLDYTGTAYKVYVDDELDFTINVSTPVYQGEDSISGFGNALYSSSAQSPWLGEIDLSNTYIKVADDIVWQPFETIECKRTPKGYKIAASNQEEAVLQLYNVTGVAWYYILDGENQRFKLPRTKYGFNGLRDNVGDYVPESLPNITGGMASSGSIRSRAPKSTNVFSGAFFKERTSGNVLSGNSGNIDEAYALGFDASHSSSAYQDNAPVQERTTQMYLYFYVGNYEQPAIEQTAGLNTELFNGKADNDLNNVTSAAKHDVINWGIPDMSTAISIEALPFVAPYNCYVNITAERDANTTSHGGLSINGVISVEFYNNQNTQIGMGTVQRNITAGTTITLIGNARLRSGYYCKFLGD